MKMHHLAPAVGALALVAAGAATPAFASGGRILQTFACDGQDVTIAMAPGNQGDNWGAGRVVDGGVLIPVSLEYLVHDDTAELVLDDEVVQHGAGAHSGQQQVTCVVAEQAVLADVAPPGVDLPDGTAPTDLVTMSLLVTAVRRP